MLTEIRPIEHFKELVTDVVEKQQVKTGELAQFYLSSLLTDFIDPKKLTGEPLAITYLRAMESERELSARLFKALGDIALFTSGFFAESVRGRAVDADYYIAMGTASYNHLGALHSGQAARSRTGRPGSAKRADRSLSGLFNDLSTRFSLYVEILAEVGARCRLSTASDLLALYEQWLMTGSRRTGALLRAQGIEPQKINRKPLH